MGENFMRMCMPIEACIEALHHSAPNSIGDQMRFRVLEDKPDIGEYVLQCSTESWMRNIHGTLHGGICATIVDQAMGFVAYSRLSGKGSVPTIQMQLNYHRPLLPGEDVIVHIRLLAETHSLVSMFCEASLAQNPEKLCLTASATSFLKPSKE